MMRLSQAASLLLAFSLLTSAATAHAQYAWVLRSNFVLASDDGPKIDDRDVKNAIESEPIPIDSTDWRYRSYLDHMRRMIKEKWGYPCVKDETTKHCEYKDAKLVVVFGLLRDGRVATVQVQEPSGYEVYDTYAVNAIKDASPFRPVPPELMAAAKPGSAGVRIVAAFRYVLVEGARSYYHSRRAYFDQVRKRIEVNLESPCVLQGVTCEYKVTEVSVEFSIAKDGRVGLVVVLSPSPWPVYNEYSVRAIRLASPFPNVPDDGGFSIRMTFKYSTGRPPELLVE